MLRKRRAHDCLRLEFAFWGLLTLAPLGITLWKLLAGRSS